jgi:hypothetical protein
MRIERFMKPRNRVPSLLLRGLRKRLPTMLLRGTRKRLPTMH